MDILNQIIDFLKGDSAGAISTFFLIALGIMKVAKVIVSFTSTTADDEFVEKLTQILTMLKGDQIAVNEAAGMLRTAKKESAVKKFLKNF